jgi:hypothetical protein
MANCVQNISIKPLATSLFIHINVVTSIKLNCSQRREIFKLGQGGISFKAYRIGTQIHEYQSLDLIFILGYT